MVHSIIISDLNCQILFSSKFDFHQNLTNDNMMNIVKKVKGEFDFNFAVSNSSNLDISNMSILDFETKGVKNIRINDVFKTTVYHSFCGCLYILVCDDSDNRLLAYRTLVLLIRTLRDVLPKITSYTSQFIIRADVVSIILNTLIPSGQLLYFHDQAVQQITKDIQKIIRY